MDADLSYRRHAGCARGLRLSFFVLAVLSACGGRDTKGSGPSNGGHQGGTAMSGAGADAGPATGGGAGTAGSQQDPPCLEPITANDASSCDFDAYAFDAEAEHCRYFFKARCGVTKNRFDTLDACVAACDPGGLEHCQNSADCVVQGAACCGGCEPVKAEDLRAISRAYAEVQTCPGVQCGPCADHEGPPERPYYGATCANQRCELVDVRETELGSCVADSDCRLRRGLECCECDSSGPWVAVANQPLAVANLLCGAPVSCDQTCDRTPPEDLQATCFEGRCVVSSVER